MTIQQSDIYKACAPSVSSSDNLTVGEVSHTGGVISFSLNINHNGKRAYSDIEIDSCLINICPPDKIDSFLRHECEAYIESMRGQG